MEPRRRKRTGRKRTNFKKAPRPAWPVRGLWEAAPAEERARAHATCITILEYWLGKKSKAEVASELGVTPLRVWQLSQLALSGMMAGLLKQPRRRVDRAVFECRTGETPAALKHRVVELEKKLARTEDLVRVLRTAPWASPSSESTSKGGSSSANGQRKPRGKRTAKVRHEKHAAADRGAAASQTPLQAGAGDAG